MSEEPGLPMTHPHELLAAFVDGSASPDEILSIESHLSSCAECREDVAFARAGQVALSGLPDLEEPGIARADLPGLLDEADAQIQPPTYLDERRRRGRLWEQVAWAAAVAAVVAGIIGAVVLISKQSPTASTSGPAKAPDQAEVVPTSFAPFVVNSGIDYSPDSVTALAKRLAAAPQNPAPVPSAATRTDVRSLSGAAVQLDPATVESCLRAGSGLGADAIPTYLELATFNSTPAYVGVFPSDSGGPHLLLIVVSVDGCQPLFVVSQSL
jgi:anti-sigma factor RsiW